MPIRQDDNQPNRRFGIINLVLIGFGVLLLVSSFIPSNGMQQVPRVPYSLFIDQVNDGAVKRAFITQDQIRYELSAPEEGTPPVLATTPIFDMDLPQRLEAKGVEFAAAPPKKPNIFTTILSWVVPPLIFISFFSSLRVARWVGVLRVPSASPRAKQRFTSRMKSHASPLLMWLGWMKPKTNSLKSLISSKLLSVMQKLEPVFPRVFC
jgi:ATP-dependent Zn protease